MKDVIDELSLNIDINVEKGIDKTISSLARAITKLNTAVANVGDLQRYANALGKITARPVKITANTAVAQATGATIQPEYQDVPDTKKDTTQQLQSVQKSSEKASKSIKELGGNILQTSKWFKSANKETKQNTKENEKNEKSADKSSKTFKKLVRSIGRIALYRAIRSSLSAIVKSITSGIDNLRKTDGVLDNSLKQLSQSQVAFNNSLASLISPLIKTIQPFITKVTDSLAHIVNRITEAKAVLSGADTYTKILTSDTKEWNEQLEKTQGYLLSFDKFEALDKSMDNGYTGTIETDVTMNLKEANKVIEDLEKIKDLAITIGATIGAIGFFKLLSDLPKAISGLKNFSKNLDSGITSAAGLLGFITGIFETIQGIKSIMDWNEETSSLQKVADVARVIFGIVAAIAGVVAMLKAGTIAGRIAAALSAVATVGAIVSGVMSEQEKLKYYADGASDIPKGTKFIAGEAGAEVVTTSSRGTGVTNIEQFTNAMYNALSMYGVARSTDVQFGGDVYVDRTKVGQLVESSVYNEGVRVGHFSKRK